MTEKPELIADPMGGVQFLSLWNRGGVPVLSIQHDRFIGHIDLSGDPKDMAEQFNALLAKSKREYS